MKQVRQALTAGALTLSLAVASYGGTITGSRTSSATGTTTSSRVGTITGSRTGTITGSRVGTITGSRTQSSEIGFRSLQDEFLFRIMTLMVGIQ